jgi:hypothetical protein
VLESIAVRAVVAALLLSITTGCAQVAFVDPDADLKAQLVIEEAQRLTVTDDPRVYFFVRIRGRAGEDLIRLSASGPDGAFALPLDDALRQDCGVGQRCLSITLPPGIPSGLTALTLEAPAIGHRDTTQIEERNLNAYQLVAEPLAGNEQVRLQINDPIRAAFPNTELVDGERQVELFPRKFETIWRPGPCGDPFDATADTWKEAAALPVTLSATFSEDEDPSVCLGVRPNAPDGGDTVATRTVGARAVITTFDHTYVPPTESSPLVYLTVFNLELPSEARCTEAQAQVSAAIRDAAIDIAASLEGAPVLELSPLDLADLDGEPCRQYDEPSLAADILFDRIRADVETEYGPTRQVRAVIVYVTNLRIEMPEGLSQDFAQLRNQFDLSDTMRDFVVAIAPMEAHEGLDTDETLPWLATEEPTFRTSIRSLLATSWPFKTMIHSQNTIVPLTGEDDATRFQYYRVCQASVGALFPLGEPLPDANALIPPPSGPAYRVDLPGQTLEPAIDYTSPIIALRWQGCEALCDRPPPSALPGNDTAWLLQEGC